MSAEREMFYANYLYENVRRLLLTLFFFWDGWRVDQINANGSLL